MATRPNFAGRRQFFCNCCAVWGVATLARTAMAESAPTVVPVELAPFHMVPVSNDYWDVISAKIPAGKVGSWHRHTRDFAQIFLAAAPVEVTNEGGQPFKPAPRTIGQFLYANYVKEPLVHNVANIGTGDFHVMGIQLQNFTPGRFAPRARPAPYAPIIDNERLIGWRLILEPGQKAPMITQSAPAARFTVQSGDVVETYTDQTSHELNLTHADYMSLPAGTSRAISNVGTTVVEIVEFELK